jgi:sarcosine/dimethylglycine N-methyltransferase
MSEEYSAQVRTAQQYYDSDDADNFYFHIWGGEDIHVGIYKSTKEDIASASRRTVDTMIAMLPGLDQASRVIDLGAGYGGAARQLASRFGCRVDCVNLSEPQNARNRELSRDAGLENLVVVIDGSFEELPQENAQFDVAWSQESFLHSGNRQSVFEEIDRVLKPGGHLIFTDPMQADDCPEGVLQPVLDRLHLDSLASPGFYGAQARQLGWQEADARMMTDQLMRHYGRVREELLARRDSLSGLISSDFVERMASGLQHWVSAGQEGYLEWGILLFRKPG